MEVEVQVEAVLKVVRVDVQPTIPQVDPAPAEVVLVKDEADRARAEVAVAHRVVAVAHRVVAVAGRIAVSLAALHQGAVRVADEVTRIAEVAGPAVRRNVKRT